MYLITSRQGLYVFDNTKISFSKIKKGYFFGCSYHNSSNKWFVFGYNGESEKDKNQPTFQGYIASFSLSQCQTGYEVSDWNIEVHGLDNGSHQIKIYNKRLYVLETYIQNIKIYNIHDDGTLSLYLEKSLGTKVCNAHYKVNNANYQDTLVQIISIITL